MKLFQKVAAAALAAVLALSMLTACSGGGGGAVPPHVDGGVVLPPTGGNVSTGELTAQNFGGSYTIKLSDVKDATDTRYITTDGNSIYEESYGIASLFIPTHPKVYVIDVDEKEYHEAYYGSEDFEPFLLRAATMRGGTFQYQGKTYQTETITTTDDGVTLTITYCYENGKPVYLIEDSVSASEVDNYSYMYHVEEFSLTADMDKLNLSNYTRRI